ncbi:hypothetical protein ONS95_001520 [Cadophora gregata]|uniref:uncharacterized protein n=1 Tax=Cadophora gregata TaxID=51156 RepID=UPI0026DD70EF|nr:uncharacterized protein ONS95_001520 [Cadophora gregata]KAK0111144.1 hypothetical protein ONS95_001520 [Cadophora gregata]
MLLERYPIGWRRSSGHQTSGIGRIKCGHGDDRQSEVVRTAQHIRFVRESNNRETLIFTDGACLRNGRPKPTAGCGFVYLPQIPGVSLPVKYGSVPFRLENQSPDGSPAEQTSNRAELRAVIAALQFRVWQGEGWKRLVIATDSEYAVKGATEWFGAWVRKGWKTSKNEPVKNRDLWKLLMKEIRKLARTGVEVSFWKIPREWYAQADGAAKEGAAEEEVSQFMKRIGIMYRDEVCTMTRSI